MFQGEGALFVADVFEGYYYKHVRGREFLALIPGQCDGQGFVQVVTADEAHFVPVKRYLRVGQALRTDDCLFSPQGIQLNLQGKGIRLTGKMAYGHPVAPDHDVMGPLRFFPMECRHAVVSLHHDLEGNLQLNGTPLRLTGGVGYIEGDRGRAFPERYSWAQSNAFSRPCSVMASVALLPFFGAKLWGALALLWVDGKTHCLATYKGARILRREEGALEIAQGPFRLAIQVMEGGSAPAGHALQAPWAGTMGRVIHERPLVRMRVRFTRGKRVLLDEITEGASYEHVERG